MAGGIVLVAVGLLLHASIAFFKSDSSDRSFSLGLMVWSWLPYLLALFFLIIIRRKIIPLCGVVGPLILDLTNYYAVFISPQSSTAALGLLWVPLWNLVLLGPVGMLIGWAISRKK
jgi:hypothetical protein